MRIEMRILFIGVPCPQMAEILTRLGQKGFGSYSIDCMKRGRALIENGKFELVISLERVDDEYGYGLSPLVAAYEGSLFVGIKSSGTHLWLPVVDHGAKVLGTTAVDYFALESELQDVLTHRSPRARPILRWVPPVPPRISSEAPPPVAIAIETAEERLARCKTARPGPFPLFAVRPLPLVRCGSSFPPAKRPSSNRS
jgi:hypothetical protein